MDPIWHILLLAVSLLCGLLLEPYLYLRLQLLRRSTCGTRAQQGSLRHPDSPHVRHHAYVRPSFRYHWCTFSHRHPFGRWSVAILMLVCHMVMVFNGHYSKQKKYAATRLSAVRFIIANSVMFHLRIIFQMLSAPYLAHLVFAVTALIVRIHF